MDVVCDAPFNEAVTTAVSLAPMIPAVATNVADVEPGATATDGGTPRELVLLERATAPPPAFESVTEQSALEPEARLAGEHPTEVRDTVVTVSVAVAVAPFSAAVIAAAPLPAPVALKIAVVDPAGMETNGGTTTAGLPLVKDTVPPDALLSVTLQSVDPPAEIWADAQAIESVTGVAVSATGAPCKDPFRLAVMVAVWLVSIAPALMANVWTAEPGGAVTAAGTSRLELSLDSWTVPPLVFESVTLQELLPPWANVDGLQLSKVTRVGLTSETAVVKEDPFRDAVMLAVSSC